MTEPNVSAGPEQPARGGGPSERNAVNIVYLLYLASLVFGITALIGVVMAYINRKEAAPDLASHYGFQIRTFWIGLLYVVIGGATSMIVIGWFLLLFWLIWLIVRCVKGMKYLSRGQPHPDPTSWLFG